MKENTIFEELIASCQWDLSLHNNVDWNGDDLYHYYSGNSVKRVFQKDAIVFRLAAASTFKDKMEGKAIEVYYDLALQSLLTSRKISQYQYNAFSSVEIPQTMSLSSLGKDGYIVFSDKEYEAYIICFSTVKDDPFMFDNYINEDQDGYCLQFSGVEMRELKTLGWNNHAKIVLMPILYGNDVIEKIKNTILEVVSNDILFDNYTYYISEALHFLQYESKLSKFSNEHEVRLVVFLAKNCSENLPNIRFLIKKGDGNLIRDKEHILFTITKDAFSGISFAPYNNSNDNCGIADFLHFNNYEF